jgi:hypothetical protein
MVTAENLTDEQIRSSGSSFGVSEMTIADALRPPPDWTDLCHAGGMMRASSRYQARSAIAAAINARCSGGR